MSQPNDAEAGGLDLEEICRQATEKINATLDNPAQHTEALLDQLINQGREVTDLEVVWGERRPLGAERLASLEGMAVLVEGPEVSRGPTPEERELSRQYLTKGDRLSTQSRITQWVVTSKRGDNIVAWGVQHEPGEESDPDAPAYVDKDKNLEVWALTLPAHLRRESKILGHCVGNRGTYWPLIQAGKCEIYSVRRGGEPRVTVEVVDGRVVQQQGKSGRPMQPEEAAVFEAFLARRG